MDTLSRQEILNLPNPKIYLPSIEVPVKLTP